MPSSKSTADRIEGQSSVPIRHLLEIDVVNRHVNVRHAYTEVNGHLIFKDPKTDNGGA